MHSSVATPNEDTHSPPLPLLPATAQPAMTAVARHFLPQMGLSNASSHTLYAYDMAPSLHYQHQHSSADVHHTYVGDMWEEAVPERRGAAVVNERQADLFVRSPSSTDGSSQFSAPAAASRPHQSDMGSVSTAASVTDTSAIKQSASSSSLASGSPASAAERKRRRVEKHREVDSLRRSREAKALASLLDVLCEEQQAQERREQKRARRPTAPRSRAQVLETAVTRMRSMRAAISSLETAPPQTPETALTSNSDVNASTSSSSLSQAASVGVRLPGPSLLDSRSALTADLPGCYEMLFRCTPDHAMLFSARTRACLDVSDDFCSWAGYDSAQMIGTVVDLCPFSPLSQLPAYGLIDYSASSASGDAAKQESCIDAVDSIPEWQATLNRQQLAALFRGEERRVQCLFRLVLSDKRRVDGWFRCWTVGPQNSANQLLVIQTNAESYVLAA